MNKTRILQLAGSSNKCYQRLDQSYLVGIVRLNLLPSKRAATTGT
jgi:hypothetical protein